MEKTGQWRFTPPTHVVAALAEAMTQFVDEGGQPARLARYTDNCRTLVDGMARLGFMPFLEAGRAGAHHRHLPRAGATRAYDFKRFYDGAKARGFMLYPGKLTQVETFRVGCIGAIGRERDAPGGGSSGRHAEGNGHREQRRPGALRSGMSTSGCVGAAGVPVPLPQRPRHA
jgi:aspartate aminotransferase-like enzyme